MKIRRKQVKTFTNSKKNEKRKEYSKNIYKRWITRPRKFSKVPYLIIISFFKRNVFLTVADLRGRIKLWINAGRLGFTSRDKADFVAVVTVMNAFLKKVWAFGVRYVLFKFKSFGPRHYAIEKALRRYKKKKRYKLFILGAWTEWNVSFNGCRKKKLRRVVTNRKPRRRKKIRIEERK